MQTVTTQITNGVNVADLMQTIEAVKSQPEIARFNFSVSNKWLGGGRNQTKVCAFTGAMQKLEHSQTFTMDADEPPILLGKDEGANPVEFLLHALAACVTTSMVYHAAGQGIAIESVESTLEGDIDLRGFLGIDRGVRNGYQGIRMKMRIKTDATEKQWERLVRLGPSFSPVFDSVTKGVPVEVTAERL